VVRRGWFLLESETSVARTIETPVERVGRYFQLEVVSNYESLHFWILEILQYNNANCVESESYPLIYSFKGARSRSFGLESKASTLHPAKLPNRISCF
jgi:hypothetical protein